MKVILTHEQADMDALASLLGAWLLQPDALPVLPRSINRNGREYIEQFGEKLPFIEFRDLPRETVDTIFLVDTQSLITLKGMNPETRVIVYDHHPRREDLDPDWELHLTTSGANTSQLVAKLREANGALTSVQANTLMLGLHEDTGSFTYGSTTPEDLEAAAFCLTQGADLDTISRYLYPALSKSQNLLYDRLLQVIETFPVDGQTIMACKADATDIDDEISSVAHKLRDVLNPDALLLLVSTRQGIRLVARSTNDRINVASIAEAMGGGGHKRAASALIRPEKHLSETEIQAFLDAQYQEMIASLSQHILPASAVADIMSRDPLLLAPDTPVSEAHRLMQRYGYEGYPVVAEGRVVGLLNRREVDRVQFLFRVNQPAHVRNDRGKVRNLRLAGANLFRVELDYPVAEPLEMRLQNRQRRSRLMHEFVHQLLAARLLELEARLQRFQTLLDGSNLFDVGWNKTHLVAQIQLDRLLRGQHQIPAHLLADEVPD